MASDAAYNLQVLHALPRRSRLVYVVLLALAWLQVSFASHQFEHAVGDLADSCVVCSHFDRLEHSVAPDLDPPHAPHTRPVFFCRLPVSADARFESAYSPRAPPAV